MSWGSVFLLAMSCGYLGAAIAYAVDGGLKWWMALALFNYAIANIGLIGLAEKWMI